MAGDGDDMRSKQQAAQDQLHSFWIILQIVGGLMLLTLATWIYSYLGGFGWADPAVRFNFHPLFMSLGMVYLAGNSILAFRILRHQPKQLVKLVHGSLHVAAFVISAIGSIAVFSFHLEKNIPNLYSLHSWIGASTMSLFFLQYFGAFYNFMYPTTSSQFRTWLLPYHVLGGFFIFGLAIVSCLTGLTEKALFLQNPKYSDFTGSTFAVNFVGIFMIIFAGLVFYLGTDRKFRRIFVSENQPLAPKSNENSMQLDSPTN